MRARFAFEGVDGEVGQAHLVSLRCLQTEPERTATSHISNVFASCPLWGCQDDASPKKRCRNASTRTIEEVDTHARARGRPACPVQREHTWSNGSTASASFSSPSR